MSGNGKKILESVEEVLKEIIDLKKNVKDLEKVVKQNENQSNIDSEILQHIHSVVSDISCKLDLGVPSIATTSVKKSSSKSTTKTNADSKPKLNIMTFFKQKYKDDPESMESFLSKKEIEDLFKKHSSELGKKKKSTLQQAQISLIYKELIKDNSDKMEALRKLKKEEDDKEDDIVEDINEENEGNNADEEGNVSENEKSEDEVSDEDA